LQKSNSLRVHSLEQGDQFSPQTVTSKRASAETIAPDNTCICQCFLLIFNLTAKHSAAIHFMRVQ
jgi:hypothetical protein